MADKENIKTEDFVTWVKSFVEDKNALWYVESGKNRIGKAYAEVLSGYNIDPSKILKEVEKVTDHKGLICEAGIRFMSMCQHHFLPFIGTADIVYEPGMSLVGLGKIARLVQVFAKRLQFQEKLSKNIADEFMSSGHAKGVYVQTKAKHLCMCHRGPNDPNAQTTTFYALGSMENNDMQEKARALINHTYKNE